MHKALVSITGIGKKIKDTVKKSPTSTFVCHVRAPVHMWRAEVLQNEPDPLFTMWVPGLEPRSLGLAADPA